jgi:hypothetical protein
MSTKNVIIAIILSITMLVISIVGYVQIKYYTTKKEVREYLLNEKGYSESTILKLEPFIANLSGDMNWMVAVELKEDEGHYYYYYDRKNEEVVFESYILNGMEYGDLSEIPDK